MRRSASARRRRAASRVHASLRVIALRRGSASASDTRVMGAVAAWLQTAVSRKTEAIRTIAIVPGRGAAVQDACHGGAGAGIYKDKTVKTMGTSGSRTDFRAGGPYTRHPGGIMRTWLLAVGCVSLYLGPLAAEEGQGKFTGDLKQIKQIASTVPANGDVNPYGIAVVPRSTGALVENDILVSNFNNSANLQGTGTTIDEISPGGHVKVFAQISASSVPNCIGGVGLTTALVVLRAGWVIVGSLPTSDGTSGTAKAGCLIVLNRWGQPVETFQGD